MDLNGKVAWITGGARMGKAVALSLAQAGCGVALSYSHSRKLAEETAQELRLFGAPTMVLACDLIRPHQAEKAARHIEAQLGSLNILVNMASVYERGSWEKHIRLHVFAAQNVTSSVLPYLRRSDEGRIVHVTDWTSASHRPRYKGYAAYYTSKAALQAMVEAMALELAPQILVNAIAPGPLLAPKGLGSKEFQAVLKATPLGKWGGPQELAKAVRFLCETDFITGETIRVDGGRHLI